MSGFARIFRSKKSKRGEKRSKSKKRNASDLSPIGLGRIFKELDCPVCFNTCTPPIHSCVNGHIICNNCRQNVEKCPSCRHGFGGTRNFFAENFITNCSQSCRYSDEGCEYLQLKGEDMRPHESQCIFRPIICLIPTCGEEVPYKSLLTHLTQFHSISASDMFPTSIRFHADHPIIHNRKWLPFAIRSQGNVFYVMMEVVRPHFWIWVLLQGYKVEESYDVYFTAHITIKNAEKKLKLIWEGPVHSIRMKEEHIKKEGLCLVAHEVFLQHFICNGYFNFSVDIKKTVQPTTTAKDMNGNNVAEMEMEMERSETETPLTTPPMSSVHAVIEAGSRGSPYPMSPSGPSLYDTSLLREVESSEDQPLAPSYDTFMSKS